MTNLLKFLFADDKSIVSSVCEDPANQNQLQSHNDLIIIFGTRFWFRYDRYNAIKRSIMSIDLQRLFSKPRDRMNPQFAHQTHYRKGFDQSTGVLYNLIDPDDLPIYRTVRDEDDVYSGQELQLSKEFSTNDKKKIPGARQCQCLVCCH